MIFIYISVLLLCFILLCIWCQKLYIALLLFIIIVVLTQYDISRKSFFYTNDPNIPRYTSEQCFHEFRHGDIINNVTFKTNSSYCPYRYFNHRMAHCALIIEENGEKYVYENDHYHKKWDSRRIMSTSDSYNNGTIWAVRKTLLMEYLKFNFTQAIRIYRPPKYQPPLIIPKNSTEFNPIYVPILNKNIYYCTLLVGHILSYNKIIPVSSKFFRYQTNDLIDEIEKAGYTSFICIVNS